MTSLNEYSTIKSIAAAMVMDPETRSEFTRLLAVLKINVEKRGQLQEDLKNTVPLRSILIDLIYSWSSKTLKDVTVESFLGELEAAEFLVHTTNKVRVEFLGESYSTETQAYFQQLAKYNSRIVSNTCDIQFHSCDAVDSRLAQLLDQYHIPESEIEEQTFRDKFKEERDSNDELRATWESAEIRLGHLKTKVFFSGIKDDETQDMLRKVIMCYTIEDPACYHDFNEQTRTYDPMGSASYNYRCYFNALVDAIFRLDTPLAFDGEDKYLYRGMVGHIPDDQMKCGSVISFQHFVSTSTSRAVAEDFAKMSIKENKILFKIIPALDNVRMASIREVSANKREDEVLISPFVRYQVQNVTRTSFWKVIVLKPILLKGFEKDVEITQHNIHDIVTIMKKKLSSGREIYNILDAVLEDRSQIGAIKLQFEENKNYYNAYMKMLESWICSKKRPTYRDLADILMDDFHLGCAGEILALGGNNG